MDPENGDGDNTSSYTSSASSSANSSSTSTSASSSTGSSLSSSTSSSTGSSVSSSSSSTSSTSTSSSSSSFSSGGCIDVLVNGDFSAGLAPWSLWTDPSATASAQVTGGEFTADITTAAADWQVQLAVSGINLLQDETYTLMFDGRAAAAAKTITVVLRENGGSYTTYFQQSFILDTSMNTFQASFTMSNPGDPAAQLLVYLGSDTTSVALDNFSLYVCGVSSSSSSSSCSVGILCYTGSVPAILAYIAELTNAEPAPDPGRGLVRSIFSDTRGNDLYVANGGDVGGTVTINGSGGYGVGQVADMSIPSGGSGYLSLRDPAMNMSPYRTNVILNLWVKSDTIGIVDLFIQPWNQDGSWAAGRQDVRLKFTNVNEWKQYTITLDNPEWGIARLSFVNNLIDNLPVNLFVDEIYLTDVYDPRGGASFDWTVALTTPENTVGLSGLGIPPTYEELIPDGHIASVPDTGGSIVFFSEHESFRTTGPNQLPDSQTGAVSVMDRFSPPAGGADSSRWSGGTWLNSVFRLGGDQFVGFFHAEDHFGILHGDNVYKSLGMALSDDEGQTWHSLKIVVESSDTRSATGGFHGAGDHCVVYDDLGNRWVALYFDTTDNPATEGLHLAASSAADGGSGWQKWNGNSFSGAAIGGPSTRVPGLAVTPGANPSIHYNSYLKKWVLVYHGWGGNIYVSASDDLIRWEKPRVLVSDVLAAYPVIIGDTDVTAAQDATIYYAKFHSGDKSTRDMIGRSITFTRND